MKIHVRPEACVTELCANELKHACQFAKSLMIARVAERRRPVQNDFDRVPLTSLRRATENESPVSPNCPSEHWLNLVERLRTSDIAGFRIHLHFHYSPGPSVIDSPQIAPIR